MAALFLSDLLLCFSLKRILIRIELCIVGFVVAKLEARLATRLGIVMMLYFMLFAPFKLKPLIEDGSPLRSPIY